MSRLGARLRRTLAAHAEPARPALPRSLSPDDLERYDRLRRRALACARGEASPAVDLADAIGGHAETTPYGDAWVVDTRLPLAGLHGSRRLGAFYDRDLDHVPMLTADTRLEGRVPDDALFLDIEATGLDHGAGTHAFLVGLGYRDGQDFVVRQILMREPADEQAALQLLVERLDQHPMLVSFNGKSYDLSVLQTRLIIQRFYTHRDCDLKLRPHLDLLHLTRNLYRGRWDDTRLATVEREVLGFHRQDDVPGHLVPSCWYHFLRTDDAGPLAGVMVHNLHDVLSMVTLADRLVADAWPDPDPTRDHRVSVNLARLLTRRGNADRAANLLETCLDAEYGAGAELTDTSACPDRVQRDALAALATAARRSGRQDLRRRALRRLVAADPDDVVSLRALAIVEERVTGDLARALELARELDRRVGDARSSRRVSRLAARLSRQLGRTGGSTR